MAEGQPFVNGIRLFQDTLLNSGIARVLKVVAAVHISRKTLIINDDEISRIFFRSLNISGLRCLGEINTARHLLK